MGGSWDWLDADWIPGHDDVIDAPEESEDEDDED